MLAGMQIKGRSENSKGDSIGGEVSTTRGSDPRPVKSVPQHLFKWHPLVKHPAMSLRCFRRRFLGPSLVSVWVVSSLASLALPSSAGSLAIPLLREEPLVPDPAPLDG